MWGEGWGTRFLSDFSVGNTELPEVKQAYLRKDSSDPLICEYASGL